MSTVDLADIKLHLNRTDDVDDDLLEGKLAAAQTWVLQFTGIDTVDDDNPLPEPCNEAIRQLVAHWYMNREAVLAENGITPAEVPFGVHDLIRPYRTRFFG